MTETLCKKYILKAGNYCKPTLLTIFTHTHTHIYIYTHTHTHTHKHIYKPIRNQKFRQNLYVDFSNANLQTYKPSVVNIMVGNTIPHN